MSDRQNPFGCRTADKAKTLYMILAVAVIALLVGLGVWYWYRTQKHKSGSTLSSAKLAAPAMKHHSKQKAAAGKGGEFQPGMKDLKAKFQQQKDEQQFAESLQAEAAHKLAGINDLGLEDVNCNSPLGPNAGKGQRVDIHNLVPNSWRDDEYKAAEDPCTEGMDTNWAAHAPTSKQFKTFIRASGIGSFGASDHIINANGRWDGIMRSSNPPAPTSGKAHFMNDSDARQSALADTLGDLESVTDIACL